MIMRAAANTGRPAARNQYDSSNRPRGIVRLTMRMMGTSASAWRRRLSGRSPAPSLWPPMPAPMSRADRVIACRVMPVRGLV